MKQSKFKETEIGKIPEGWDVKELGNLIDLRTGKLDSNAAEQKGEYPFFTCAPSPLRINKHTFDCEAILLAGNNANGIFHINRYAGKFNAYQRTYVITTGNETNLDYLFYALQLHLNYLKDISQGSATKFLTKRIIEHLKIGFPNLQEQKAIAKILSDLDSKIELNNEMNRTLEAIGQAIFKHWFVDFEFPNDEGMPYMSSDGEMVDSELGAIPKGWRVVELKDCGDVICGKTPPTRNKDNYGDEIPFITIPDMRRQTFVVKTEKKLSLVGAKTQKKKELPHLSVCVSCIATPGLVALTSETSHTNQQINSIICKSEISPYFIYLTLSRMSEQIKLLGLGGTATLNLNTGEFSKIEIACPPKSIVEAFQVKVEIIFNKLLMHVRETKILSDIRDSLLSRLMSGKIRVKLK